MRQPTHQQRPRVPSALWSEIFALWRDGARRPALPLLLAMLLFAFAPFINSANCSTETGGHSHTASRSHAHSSSHVHGVAAADDHHSHGEAATDDHHAHNAAPQVAATHGATLQAPAMCCSCSSEPIHATVATVSAPKNPQADSQALIYAASDATPIYRADALEGLHTRAGPPTGKPQLFSLASLIGRAPPVSL